MTCIVQCCAPSPFDVRSQNADHCSAVQSGCSNIACICSMSTCAEMTGAASQPIMHDASKSNARRMSTTRCETSPSSRPSLAQS